MSLQKFQHISKHARRAAATALAATALVVLWPTPTHAAGAAQIERGRYLVRISGCNDCHTEGYMAAAGKVDESRWLTGSQLGWQGPWGTTYAANLRISMQNLTLAQWLQAARAPRRPPMPWFALRDMKDEDLASIYHFVRSLGPAGGAAPEFVPPGGVVRTPVATFPAGDGRP
jgi:mono/diheme cytochrome c family protein